MKFSGPLGLGGQVRARVLGGLECRRGLSRSASVVTGVPLLWWIGAGAGSMEVLRQTPNGVCASPYSLESKQLVTRGVVAFTVRFFGLVSLGLVTGF